MNQLQIFQKTKGNGTTTDPEKRPFTYLHKVAEIEYDEMGDELVRTASRVAENFKPGELAFHNGERLLYKNESIG